MSVATSKLLNGTEWYPHPTPLTNFSSDLDESQNRSLGQVGGRVPPVPPVATPLAWAEA